MALSDDQIKDLLYWFVTDSETRKKWSNKRKSALEENHRWIQPSVIEKLSDEELKGRFLDYYNSNTGYKQNLNKLFRDRIIRDVGNFRKTIKVLFDEKIDIIERIDGILEGDYKIEGFGKGILTAFLMDFDPDKYCLWNQKTEQGFEVLGWQIHKKGDSSGRKYQKVLGELRNIADLSPDLNLTFNDVDLFLHTISAEEEGIRKVGEFTGGAIGETSTGFWQIAPADSARLWDDLRTNSIAAVGFSKLNLDLGGKSKNELLELSREYYPDYTEHQSKTDVAQLWHFLNLKPGDKFVTNKGRSLLLGLGIVKGTYKFRPERKEYKHTIDVEYYQVSETGIPIPENLKGKFGKIIVPLTQDEFETLEILFHGREKLSKGGPQDQPPPNCPFSIRTFELLAGLHENPTRAFYQNHGQEFKEHVEEPFQQLFQQVGLLLPPSITDLMETEKGVFARIIKNDFGKGGAWDYYWGAFYPKEGQRIKDAQLFLWMNRDRLEFGFYIGEYGPDQRDRFLRNCKKNQEVLDNILRDSLADDRFRFGKHQEFIGGVSDSNTVVSKLTWDEWLKNPEEAGIHVCVFLNKSEVLQSSAEQLKNTIVKSFGQLFPLVLLATSEDPFPAISKYLDLLGEGIEPNPLYTLSQFALEAGFEEGMLLQWVRAIERKGQVIVYGPPGTGKTYVAEKLARHLIGGDDGFYELVQFHPAYAYEDFVQGIRPESRDDGSLFYPLVPGRFLDFCGKARSRKGRCVLIIDEINRANLARVFGELMYLLEYRDRAVPLASGGEFRIPANVRVIGTMNTADRSIALVDHALRRRFAFLALYPNYDVLRKFHYDSGFPVERLISILEELNKKIGDPHYEVGITFFLRKDVGQQLGDIWKMEIEPYLEEYFYDQMDTAKEFSWDKVKDKVLSWVKPCVS